MVFKGGITMFGRENEELLIRSLHFMDTSTIKRSLDLRRILRGIGDAPRQVHIHESIGTDDRSSDHREPAVQLHDDCQLLQLTDVLTSGFRTILGEATHQSHIQLCRPLVALHEKWSRGRKGF